MAMSIGQEKGRGHSDGAVGHGGHHRMDFTTHTGAQKGGSDHMTAKNEKNHLTESGSGKVMAC
jgi:hypothetical protein